LDNNPLDCNHGYHGQEEKELYIAERVQLALVNEPTVEEIEDMQKDEVIEKHGKGKAFSSWDTIFVKQIISHPIVEALKEFVEPEHYEHYEGDID